jgi:glycerophosphoryl diester phosphodiesterase
VLAHRGLATDAPENTLLAFAAALGLGVTHIETDVHASSDREAVIAHDPDLRRVAGVDGSVREHSLASLRRIDLGRGQSFCSLREALDAFPEASFNIDIKAADAVGPTVEAILDAKAVDRVLVTSFSESRRIAAVRRLPGVATSASARGFATALVAGKSGAAPLLRRALRTVDAVQIPERYSSITLVTERMMRLLHSAKVEVHVWTVNDAPSMHRLLELGVDGIVTDRADIALGVIAERANQRP